MTRRKRKRPLEFESLEAMELLSGAGMAIPHEMVRHRAAQVHRAPKASAVDVALNLSGTLKGTYHVAGRGTTAGFNGRGPVSPVGRAQLRGTIGLGASSGGGELTLNFGRRGKIFAAVTGLTLAGAYTYQISGGTRTFVGDTGTGVAVVDILSSNAAQTRGRFALGLQGSASA